jgi:hypothetical protein
MTALAISEGLIKILDCSTYICVEQNYYVLIFPLIALVGIFLLIIIIILRKKNMKMPF